MGVGMRVPAIVFDIDGVLCDSAQSIADAIEAAHAVAEHVDWIEWNKGEFACHPEYVALAQLLAQADVAIILLTARQEPSREVTELWLQKHSIPFDELLMRPMDHDYFTWKQDALLALRSSAFDVKVVLEDSSAHVAAIRREVELPVIHVQNVGSHLQ
jgi:phosphoglycolate phosphatase-like HAD superfamily hydrolase